MADSTDRGSRMPDQSSDYRVAIFGAGGVGKSSIVQRFINNTFNESYNPTIEDTFRTVIGCAQKGVCTLHITDTAGSHQFPAMQRLAISKGDAFLLCYSVSSKQTLEELGPIVTMLKETKGAALANTPILLVATKCDESTRQVSVELGKKLSEKWGMPIIETSAKENINVREMFQKLLDLEKRRQLTLTVDGNAGKKKGKCCVQ